MNSKMNLEACNFSLTREGLELNSADFDETWQDYRENFLKCNNTPIWVPTVNRFRDILIINIAFLE